MKPSTNIPGGPHGRRGRVLAGLCAALICTVLLAGPASAGLPNTWTSVASMITGRFVGVSATLPSGDVLVAGGDSGSGAIASAEIYNPAADTWTSAAALSTPRFAATAVRLASGRVLVVGGKSANSSAGALNTGEVYDPAANTWTPVANTMSSARGDVPAAALLPGGKVLIAGGDDASGNPVSTADIYDPVSNSFTPASPMGAARAWVGAILLTGGKVLVAGGQGSSGSPVATAETYDPGANTWSPASNAMSSPRTLPKLALLPGGKVLVVGGVSSGTSFDNPSITTATTDLYDPSTGSFSAGPAMAVSRVLFGMTSLADGRVLAVGGISFTGSKGFSTGDTEIYDPASNSWSEAGALPAVGGPTVNLLSNGDVLAAGGTADANTGSTQAKIFTPTSKPNAPVAVSAAPANRSAYVTFAPPLTDGGLSILHYTIKASTGQTVTTPDGRTFATFTGLTNGRRVTFTVSATNSLGTGPASTPSNLVTPHASGKGPTLRIFGLARKLTLTRFLTGVRFTVKPNRASSLQISLLATPSQATIARALGLTLASKNLRRSARRRAVKLVPSHKLVGHPRKARVEVLIVATDAAGSRSTISRWITIVP